MILPAARDPRLTTIRRGGTLSDAHHRMLALWAADCAERVLRHFTELCPHDGRPAEAIRLARAWARGAATLVEAKVGAYHANAAARDLSGAARFAAYSAGQAAVVAHVAAHYLGAAAYAIRAAMEAGPASEREAIRLRERAWQLGRVPAELLELVLDDQRRRDDICWQVFGGAATR
jgi:hypothetical protein